jgi:hypothetical protein
MAMHNPELGVKQYVAVVENSRGTKFMVFETGDPKYYLFSVLKDGCQGGLMFPVRKMELRPDIRKALKAGYGNSSI